MNFLEKVWTSLMSTDEHQYLHFDTCLASHEKNGIDWKDYALGELTLYLIQINLRTGLEKLGCPDKLVNKETKRAKKSFVRSSNNKSKKNIQGDRQKGLPLMVTYNPFLSHLGQTIRKTFSYSIKVKKSNVCLLRLLLFLYALLGPLGTI